MESFMAVEGQGPALRALRALRASVQGFRLKVSKGVYAFKLNDPRRHLLARRHRPVDSAQL